LITEGTVGPYLIVLIPPFFSQHLCFGECGENLRGTDDVRTFFEMTEENTEIPTYEIPA